ncbi:MAG: DegV family protein [Bacillota bacterium]|nr:DegV family protein [Bacillota bacterium]
MIRLIVDSTCDTNSFVRENFDFDIIPLSITINGISYLDGLEIQADSVYDYMRAGNLPKTSQISYESLTKVIEKCISNQDDFIYLTFSSKLSGTYNFAYKIMEIYKEKYPERKMKIIDSKGGAGGAGLIAFQTMKMINKNLPFETIVNQINFMIDHTVYYFTISDLEWLSKGGRVSKPIGYIGNVLNIKPYLTVDDGKMIVTKMVRGRKKALKTIVSDVISGASDFVNQTICISHANDMEAALYLEEKIKEVLPLCKTLIFQIGAVLGSHIGIGGIGAFYMDKKPEYYQY